MAHLIRPLRQWPPSPHRRFLPSLDHLRLLLSSHTVLLPPPETGFNRRGFASAAPAALRNLSKRPTGRPKAPGPYEFREGDYGSDSDDDPSRKSRNQKKRDARRAVHWAMDLASFSIPQIKRIVRTASLEQEVFEALTLVKKMGRDVREGKRRQFNYIGKLLREAEPELMDELIQATKDGDFSRLQELSLFAEAAVDEDDGEEEEEDVDYEEESEEDLQDEETPEYESIAARWFDGLVSKDIEITNEVYSIHSIDFDRQELRKLVRIVQSVEEEQPPGAEKSLSRFLCTLAKQMLTAEN